MLIELRSTTPPTHQRLGFHEEEQWLSDAFESRDLSGDAIEFVSSIDAS